MFTFSGSRQRFCDGINRRNFLAIGAFGAGLTLADMLRLRAASNLKQPSLARAKSAIMIYLPGGPSHMDMYDLKPDAPAEFRGEFKPIDTNVPGVQICEHFPMQAKMLDKLAVVRSLISVDEHSDSYVMTGYSEHVNRTVGHPSFGSVMSKLRNGTADVPPFVSLRGMSIGTEPGYLGIAHRPFTPDGPGLQNLKLPGNVTASRVEDRKDLLAAFDTVRRDIDASGTMRGMDAFTQRAFDMVASGTVRKALDLTKEAKAVRDRYKGVEQFLTARRLVEAGVGCVTLSYGGWDTHGGNFKTLKRQLPELDRGIANLMPICTTAAPGRHGDRGVGRVRPHAKDQQQRWRRPRPLVARDERPGRRRRAQDGPGDRRQQRPRRIPEGSALQSAATAQHALPGDGHRSRDDFPERQRPADVHPRRPRTGDGTAVVEASGRDESNSICRVHLLLEIYLCDNDSRLATSATISSGSRQSFILLAYVYFPSRITWRKKALSRTVTRVSKKPRGNSRSLWQRRSRHKRPFLSQLSEHQKETAQRFASVEVSLAEMIRVLNEHTRNS